MPCPHNGSSDADRSDEDGRLSRRQLLRAAVAIGGTSGLAACLERETDVGTATPTAQSFPTGPEDPSTLPERQHAWVDYLVRDRFGNTVLPQHQTILLLNYVGPTPPDEDARKRVEEAFRTLERAYQRGTGGDGSVLTHEGLLFVVGYAPTYFSAFEADLPTDIDLPPPEDVLAELDESEPTADPYDVAVHLASGYGSILLGAEQALFNELEEVNGIPVRGGLDGLFEVAERRTGFVGRGLPAQKYDNEEIPESADLSMGFRSSFVDTLPTEDRITIQSGPFAGGTTMQVSRLEHDLDDWYDHDHLERTERMFSPEHDPEAVGKTGVDLGSSSGMTEEIAKSAPEDATTEGVVGHGQKTARARDEDFDQRIMRRDFDATAEPGLHFDSWQRGIEEFLKVRRAMNGVDIDVDLPASSDGILGFISVTNRATFLMPPRSLRALPQPNP